MLFMENPLIAGFVDKQHEAQTWAGIGKTTEGQASPSDCHEAAKVMSEEYFLWTTYHCSCVLLWNLVTNFSSGSIFIFNFNVDDAFTLQLEVKS
jgi:hypothetical protein